MPLAPIGRNPGKETLGTLNTRKETLEILEVPSKRCEVLETLETLSEILEALTEILERFKIFETLEAFSEILEMLEVLAKRREILETFAKSSHQENETMNPSVDTGCPNNKKIETTWDR